VSDLILPGPDLTGMTLSRMSADKLAFRAHPWHAIQQRWVFTEDEHPPPDTLPVRPMPPKPYIEALVALWLESPLMILCKSRQVMASWVFAYLTVWWALTHEGAHCLFQGKREKDVAATGTKGLLGRARFIRRHLPAFVCLPDLGRESDTAETYGNGSTLEAIPEGEDIIRSKTISTATLDEIAFYNDPAATWNAALPAAKGGGRVCGITTPDGQGFPYREADAGRLWDDWRKWPELVPGLHTYLTSRGVQLVALHYTADEDERTPEAQAKRREGYTSVQAYRRENELDFSISGGLGVFVSEFSPAVHVIETYKPDPLLPIWRGWDPGYNGQAVSWGQFNHRGQLVWFDQVIYRAVPLVRVIQEVKLRTAKWLGEAARPVGFDDRYTKLAAEVIDVGDPAAGQHHASGDTVLDELLRHGIRLQVKVTTGRGVGMIEQVRALLLPRSDGSPGLLVARTTPEMQHVLAGLGGGYRYADTKEGRATSDTPLKDGFYDHIFDGFKYLVDWAQPIRAASPSDEVGPDKDLWLDKDTGVGADLATTDGYGYSSWDQ
jgi:hypothetical protein